MLYNDSQYNIKCNLCNLTFFLKINKKYIKIMQKIYTFFLFTTIWICSNKQK